MRVGRLLAAIALTGVLAVGFGAAASSQSAAPRSSAASSGTNAAQTQGPSALTGTRS